MKLLPPNWFSTDPIDEEYKNYLLQEFILNLKEESKKIGFANSFKLLSYHFKNLECFELYNTVLTSESYLFYDVEQIQEIEKGIDLLTDEQIQEIKKIIPFCKRELLIHLKSFHNEQKKISESFRIAFLEKNIEENFGKIICFNHNNKQTIQIFEYTLVEFKGKERGIIYPKTYSLEKKELEKFFDVEDHNIIFCEMNYDLEFESKIWKELLTPFIFAEMRSQSSSM